MLTTENGRMQASSIRDAVYLITGPYSNGGACPVGRDTDEWEETDCGHYT